MGMIVISDQMIHYSVIIYMMGVLAGYLWSDSRWGLKGTPLSVTAKIVIGLTWVLWLPVVVFLWTIEGLYLSR
jgi:hypothetical protein